MSSIFFNYKNSKTSEPHRLLLNLLGQIDLKNMLPSILVSTTHKKKNKKKQKKIHTKTVDLKYQLQLGMESLSYAMSYVLY